MHPAGIYGVYCLGSREADQLCRTDCIPFWAASVCSCCKKAKKHLIPRINLLDSGVMQYMMGYQAVGSKGP